MGWDGMGWDGMGWDGMGMVMVMVTLFGYYFGLPDSPTASKLLSSK